MKKLVAILALGTIASGAFAQGTVGLANGPGTQFYTNAVGLGGVSGQTKGPGGTYDYEVLTAPSTAAAVDASLQALLNGGVWSDTGLSGTNTSAGTGKLNGGTDVNTADVNHWAGGVQQDFIVIGWSAAIGSFSNLLADLNGASLTAQNGGFVWTGAGFAGLAASATPLFLGATTVQAIQAGTPGQSQSALFGSSVTAQGTPVMTTSAMYAISVPEPTTFAMLGLGAASMLIFRRRK